MIMVIIMMIFILIIT